MITVLLVDDEPDFREPLAANLRRSGFEVIEVGSRADAVARLENSRSIDIIVTDLNMADTAHDPYSTVARLRQASKMPIIVLTGYAPHESAAESLKMEIDDYMAKISPGNASGVEVGTKLVDTAELVARIHKRVRRSPAYEFPVSDSDPSKGCWRLDTVTRTIQKSDGTASTDAGLLYEILLSFLRNPGICLDARDLKMEDRQATQAVYKLRKLIGQEKIRTVKAGYVFAAKVTPV